MKTYDELKALIRSVRWSHINAHVHTHLCDGRPEMTVDNIGTAAQKAGVELVILTPHFHKRVSDASETLYDDTREEILWRLRDEIDRYSSKSKAPVFLLSAEADILNREGEIALNPSPRTVDALDLISPTMNYNVALPLHGVHLTYGHDRDGLYDSGIYDAMVQAAGGVENVIATMYEMEVNAVLSTTYPSLLGHVFAAHSFAGRHNWFGMKEKHLPLIQKGAERIIESCSKKGVMIDITGIIRPVNVTPEEHALKDGFLYIFQKWFLEKCARVGVVTCPGSDAHALSGIDKALSYGVLFDTYEAEIGYGTI